MCTYKRNHIACKDYALFSMFNMFSCQSHHSYCTRFSLLVWEVEISEKVCITHMHVYLYVNWCRKIHGVHMGAIYYFQPQTRQTREEWNVLHSSPCTRVTIIIIYSLCYLIVKNACMYGTFLKTIKIPGMFVVVILKMHLYQLSQIRRDDNIYPCMQEEQLLYKGTLRE